MSREILRRFAPQNDTPCGMTQQERKGIAKCNSETRRRLARPRRIAVDRACDEECWPDGTCCIGREIPRSPLRGSLGMTQHAR
jgi:hypothetical protein